jgi:hypothetical protein
MDDHVPMAITTDLRLRGVNVVTAQEDDAGQFEDSNCLTALRPCDGFLLRMTPIFSARPRAVADLDLCMKTSTPKEWINRVEYLPL